MARHAGEAGGREFFFGCGDWELLGLRGMGGRGRGSCKGVDVEGVDGGGEEGDDVAKML